MGTWTKITANLWKCWQVRKRHFITTPIIILLPILLFAVLGYGRSQISGIGKQTVPTPTYNKIWSEELIYERYKLNGHDTVLYYAPSTEFTDNLMHNVQVRFGLLNNGIKAFANEEELLRYYNKNGTEAISYAVIFKDASKNSKKLDYIIRNYEKYLDWETEELFPFAAYEYVPGRGSENYFSRGFIVLQMAIDTAFYEIKSSSDSLPVNITMQEFPYPPYTTDMGVNDLFMHVLPFVTLFSFMLTCPSILKGIVEEKDSGIKELMKMMGLPTSVMWFCWFVEAIIINSISIVFIVFLMKWDWNVNFSPIEYTHFSIFGLFLFFYCCSCIALCFFISTMFQSSNYTTVAGILIWLITYLIPYSVGSRMALPSICQKLLVCLCPNIAMYYGYQAISIYEIRGQGVQWSNLFKSASGGLNDLTMGYVLIMFIIDTMFFMILTFYFDSVMPGKYGLPKPWNFPIKTLIQATKNLVNKHKSNAVQCHHNYPENEYTRIEKCDSNPGIQINSLRKMYGNKEALKGLDIDFYDGETTVLLGRNGAGKSTTLNILTGLLKPTSGKIYIHQTELTDNLDYIRTQIGICPQHNLLFNELTVAEHLHFFAKLKNLKNIEPEVNRLLSKLQMEDKKNNLPASLSGGMKRKLCLGMAIIGNPMVLILDEPTSGLDPKSRREIWDILLNWKTSKNTVIVSTHFMEEAEVLGQRIAIIDNGCLISYGTPMYLKNEYSTGYVLTISYTNGINLDKLKAIVKEDVKEESSKMVRFLLKKENKHNFATMLRDIENKKSELGIDAYNLSITTLEDVFLKVANRLKNSDDKTDEYNLPEELEPKPAESGPVDYKNKFIILWGCHWRAFKIMLRNTYWLYILIAVLIFGFTQLLSVPSSLSIFNGLPSLNLNLKQYGITKVYLSGDNDNAVISRMMQHYIKTAKEQKALVTVVPSVSEALINLGINNIEEYKQHAIVAAEFNRTDTDTIVVNVMYSNLALHGAPIALNLVFDSILKAYLDVGSKVSITNEPLFKSNEDDLSEHSEVQVALIWMLFFPLGLLFLTGCFINYPLKENNSNLKHLLYMTGIKKHCYWFNMFAFDYICFAALISVLTLIILFNPTFQSFLAYGMLLAILCLYAIPAIPFAYLFSYKKTMSSAFGTYVMFNLFSGVVLATIVTALELSGHEYYENIGQILHHIFHLSPQYWLTYRLIQYSRSAVMDYNWLVMDPNKKTHICQFSADNPCCSENQHPLAECNALSRSSIFLDKQGSLFPFVIFLCSAFAYLGLLTFLDSVYAKIVKDAVYKMWYSCIMYNSNDQDSNLEGSNGDEGKSFFSVKRLSKTIGNKKIVKNLSIKISAGECYGLLGVNGAGKTTTFKMLTGDERPTNGKFEIDKIDENDYLKNVGYCPQYNAMNGILSGEEMLELFARLRNVKEEDIDDQVRKWIKALDLPSDGRPCGQYSGGNMRKLSLALAMIGKQRVIMLDEPTTGVDPAARRKIWNILKARKKLETQCIILTSHSMDECEELCDWLAIMKQGRIDGQGTIPKLKEEIGNVLSVLIKVKYVDSEELTCDEVDGGVHISIDAPQTSAAVDKSIGEVSKNFEKVFKELDPVLKDRHLTMLQYQVNNTGQMSELYEKMENFMKANLNVEDYIISMVTLEDVFLEKEDYSPEPMS